MASTNGATLEFTLFVFFPRKDTHFYPILLSSLLSGRARAQITTHAHTHTHIHRERERDKSKEC